MPLSFFHPVIQSWFLGRFAGPTEPQRLGWPQIVAGEQTLIAAPTGSGKTLTAFLAAIDRLLKLAVRNELPDEIRVVYVSPLRALSNDMHRNLELPLAEITRLAHESGLEIPPIRAGLRTGDTKPSQRAALLRKPPHILVTTPESLYLLLTSEKGRDRLQTVETVIVDEIHALVRDKRGSHLGLSLERLAALCPRPLQRIGLSATQRPMDAIARFLTGVNDSDADRNGEPGPVVLVPVEPGQPVAGGQPVEPVQSVENGGPASDRTSIPGEADSTSGVSLRSSTGPDGSDLPEPAARVIDVGHQRDLDLAIEVPASELGAVCMHEQWAEVHTRLCELVNSHRSTLIFVNTRRMAERLTHQLSETLGADAVSSHHGSLSADLRLDTERRLKSGELKAVVATASLELGLDVGYIDLVIQIGSPRSIATFLQRVGRSGHALGLVPRGRLFALTRDELLECMALIRAVRGGRLDRIPIPETPLDILAQQIVAEVSCREWGTDELFHLFRRAYAYRRLARADFDRVVRFLSEGLTPESGRGRVYLHHDQVGRRLRARPGARIAATTSGGAIPEIASYRVVAEPEHTVVGSLDEDFATESQAGEIFLLGNTSWRIQHVRGGDVTVTDAGGAPPTIPFWRGEAPGRTIELSQEVSRLREELEQRLSDPAALPGWLMDETSISEFAAEQVVTYAAAQKGAIGLLPSQRQVVFERFFDESGGMQLVIHAPFGSRITHAWGLALRKRFCRSFDFELQASADDDGLLLSLGPQHSFPLESMFGMLTAANVQPLLEQALLAVPTFQTRWRWNITRSLMVLRFQNGKKVPPALQRFRADDLLTAVFPKLTGCQENVVGDIELPDHPLVAQSMHDSLQEAHDLVGLQEVLQAIERGEITLIARDTREPSPFSYELLNANPYAFLDGGEAAERRARAVSTRRSLTVESVNDLGHLDPAAIERVRQEAQPLVRSADELHDVLLSRIELPVCIPGAEGADGMQAGTHRAAGGGPLYDPAWSGFFQQLAAQRRATTITHPDGRQAWAAAERLPVVHAAFPDATAAPALEVPVEVRRDWTAEEAGVTIVRGLIEISGPITGSGVARETGLALNQADAALEALEGEGVVLRGRFTPAARAQVNDSAPATGPSAAESAAAVDAIDGNGVTPPASVEMEWCHRRLLSRIHRLTMEGLRKQIEPVGIDVFVRFLTRQHGLLPDARRSGTNGLFEVVAMLQGLDLPAVVWERDLLPSRLDKYRPEWLDELCLTGEVGWGRLFPPRRNGERSRPMASLTKVVPVSMFLRSDADWLQAESLPSDPAALSSPGRQVYDLLVRRGAMFAADLLTDTRMLPVQLHEVLGELVTHGFLTADGISGLRTLIAFRAGDADPAAARNGRGMHRRRVPLKGAGRWSLWRRGASGSDEGQPLSSALPGAGAGDPSSMPSADVARERGPADQKAERREVVEQWAWQLLRRWGVLFRDLLEREDGAPRWFELLQVLRRLEARGEIRGGRFITGVGGEQFALGDTVKTLRQLRDDGPRQEFVVISAADPLNLVGILTAHPRVTRNASSRIAWLDGVPVAARVADKLQYLVAPTPELQRLVESADGLRNRMGKGPPRRVADKGGAAAAPAGAGKDGAGNATPRPRQPSLFPAPIPRPFSR